MNNNSPVISSVAELPLANPWLLLDSPPPPPPITIDRFKPDNQRFARL